MERYGDPCPTHFSSKHTSRFHLNFQLMGVSRKPKLDGAHAWINLAKDLIYAQSTLFKSIKSVWPKIRNDACDLPKPIISQTLFTDLV